MMGLLTEIWGDLGRIGSYVEICHDRRESVTT